MYPINLRGKIKDVLHLALNKAKSLPSGFHEWCSFKKQGVCSERYC
jgi:hypothetical protein